MDDATQCSEGDFAAYVEENSLERTGHDRVWWSHSPPDERALDAATRIADEFPDLRVVGTESRIQMSDVKWRLIMDDSVVVLGFYPIRADKWTQNVIADIRAALEADDGE